VRSDHQADFIPSHVTVTGQSTAMETTDEDPPVRRRESVEVQEPSERRHSAGSMGADAQEAASSSDASDSHRAKPVGKQVATQDDSALVRRLIARIADLEQKLYQHDLSDAQNQEAAPRAGGPTCSSLQPCGISTACAYADTCLT
jgi:hypothetical protein